MLPASSGATRTSTTPSMCYSDLPYLYTGRGLRELHWPYSDDEAVRARYPAMEYPVVISYWAWWAAEVTQRAQRLARPRRAGRRCRPTASAASPRCARRCCASSRSTRSASRRSRCCPRGCSPASIGGGPGTPRSSRSRRRWPSPGWSTGTCWPSPAWPACCGPGRATARCSPGRSSGSGVATKLYPAVPAGRHPRHLPAAAPVPRARRGRRGGGWCSWAAAQRAGVPLRPERLEDLLALQLRPHRRPRLDLAGARPALRLVDVGVDHQRCGRGCSSAAWCVGVLVLGLVAPATPRLAQLGFLVVAGFLLVNKVYSPQYVLWLLPLAVLARPRLRDQVIWQAQRGRLLRQVWWYLGNFLAPGDGGDAEFYWFAIVLRMAGELYLVAIVVRDILWPLPRPRARPRLARLRPASQPRLAEPQVTTTRSNVVAVKRTRTPTSSPTAGTRRTGRQEQHRGLHVRRLGEEPLLAVDGERRADEADGVQAAAGQGGGPGLDRGVAQSAPRGRCRAPCRR